MKRTEPKTPWSVRTSLLVLTMGWRQRDLKGHWGMDPACIKRVIRGGRPSVKYITTLRKLETTYAADIEAYKKGYIRIVGHGKARRRLDFRRNTSTVVHRPEDIQALGMVDTARQKPAHS